jgi:hypothetical protein
MWAAAPSSAWGAVPCKVMKINTVARAPRDIATGRKALGCFSIVNGFIFATLMVSLWGYAIRYNHKVLCDKEQLRGATPRISSAYA